MAEFTWPDVSRNLKYTNSLGVSEMQICQLKFYSLRPFVVALINFLPENLMQSLVTMLSHKLILVGPPHYIYVHSMYSPAFLEIVCLK